MGSRDKYDIMGLLESQRRDDVTLVCSVGARHFH